MRQIRDTLSQSDTCSLYAHTHSTLSPFYSKMKQMVIQMYEPTTTKKKGEKKET